MKNTGRWAKQAFIRLEVRVLRPDKMKTQLEPAGVRGEDREGVVKGKATFDKTRPDQQLEPSLQDDVREDYLSRLPQNFRVCEL